MAVAEWLQRVGRAAERANEGLAKGGMHAVNHPVQSAYATKTFINRGFEKGIGAAMGGMVKRTDPHLLNAYTGLAPTKAATGLFALGAAGYGAYSTLKGEHQSKGLNAQTDYVGAAPIMSGDGVGNRSNAPTLGASGSMVFGLHNRR